MHPPFGQQTHHLIRNMRCTIKFERCVFLIYSGAFLHSLDIFSGLWSLYISSNLPLLESLFCRRFETFPSASIIMDIVFMFYSFFGSRERTLYFSTFQFISFSFCTLSKQLRSRSSTHFTHCSKPNPVSFLIWK